MRPAGIRGHWAVRLWHNSLPHQPGALALAGYRKAAGPGGG